MSYITEDQLRNIARDRGLSVNKSLYVKSRKEDAQVSIFLSHSHKDKELVEGFIALLATYKILVYVDWQDSSMPRVTSRETADKIKRRIVDLDYFVVLATENAVISRWVPWEVGIADTRKPFERIAIMPIVDAKGEFNGNEYLQLYQTIEIAEGDVLAVFPPQITKGRKFESWLSGAISGVQR